MTRKLAIYLIFLALFTVGIFETTRRVIAEQPPTVVWHTRVVDDPPAPPTLAPTPLVQQPLVTAGDAFTPSPSGRSFAFVSKTGEVTIVDAATGHVISHVAVGADVQAVHWVSERLLLVVTTTHTLYTYDVFAARLRFIAYLQAPLNQPFAAMTATAYTNDLYVFYANSQGNTVFQFDTNEHMWAHSIGNLSVRQAYAGATDLTLYVVNDANDLYQLRGGYLSRIASSVAILAGHGNTVYLATLNANHLVTQVSVLNRDGKRSTIRTLSKPVPVGDVVVDRDGVVFTVTDSQLDDLNHGKTWFAPKGCQLRVVNHVVLLVSASGYRVVVD